MNAAAARLAGAFRRLRRAPAFAILLTLLCLLGGTLAAFAQGGMGAAASGVSTGWGAFTAWVLNPWATIGLLVAGCLLLYHDLLTPDTWGVTGTLGVLAVGAVFAAEVSAGGSGWLGVVLLLLGLALILLEIHVFPGQGSAIGGFVLMFAGMFLSLWGTRGTAFALTTTTLLTMIFGLAFLAYLPKSPAWQRIGAQLQLRAALASGDAIAVAENPCAIVGQTGRALTALRPSGMAELDGMRVPVITEGEFLHEGQSIVVTSVEGNRVLVQAETVSLATVTRS